MTIRPSTENVTRRRGIVAAMRKLLRVPPPPLREWLVIDDSRKNGVFATEEMKQPKGYIPRDVAEALLGRSMDGTVWFTKEEGEKMRTHPEWRTQWQ